MAKQNQLAVLLMVAKAWQDVSGQVGQFENMLAIKSGLVEKLSGKAV